MAEPIIKATNLQKSFMVGKNQIEALKGLDLDVASGEFIVVFGPSGCGKTTLLSLLAGLDEPTSGNVYFKNINLSKLSENDLSKYRRGKIGMVFQQFNLVPALSAKDNIALPLLLSGINRKAAEKRAGELLELVGLEDRKNHKPTELSGGQQQKVAIARALSVDPEILLVDEPTGNLDLTAGSEIMETLLKINNTGRTVILVTHNPDYVRYGHRIVYMQDGKVAKIEIQKKIDEPVKKSGLIQSIGGLSILETIRLSRIHFFSKKLRTFLTTLGVALGVGSIISLVSLGVGLQKITSDQIASLDALVTINVSTAKNSANELNSSALSQLEKINSVAIVSPMISVTGKATYADSTTQLLIEGIKNDALGFEGIKTIAGKEFSAKEGIIISKAAAKNFDIKNFDEAVGKKIKLELLLIPQGKNLTVEELANIKEVQIEEKIVGISGDELIATAYAPLSLVQEKTGLSTYNSVKVKANNRKNVKSIRDEIEKLGFSTNSVVDLIDQVDKVFLVTQVVLGIIGAIALLVALIGIVNIMTISLLERTHEVGIMKAIGARNKDVKRIFQYEVLFFGFFGGACGILGAVAVGYGLNYLLAFLMRISNIEGSLQIFVTPVYFALEVLALTMLVALLAGWYPAKRAAKLSPMEALRYE